MIGPRTSILAYLRRTLVSLPPDCAISKIEIGVPQNVLNAGAAVTGDSEDAAKHEIARVG
jgi:hypothetical protein